jgi:hypothetical protein
LNNELLPFIVSGQAGSACLIGPVVVSAIYVSNSFLKPLTDHISNVSESLIKENIEAIVPVETVVISAERYNSILLEGKSKDEILRWLHGRAIKNMLNCYPDTVAVYLGQGAPYDELSANLQDIFPQLTVTDAKDCNKNAVIAARLSAGRAWKRKLNDLIENNGDLRTIQFQLPLSEMIESKLRSIARNMNQRLSVSIFKTDLLNK